MLSMIKPTGDAFTDNIIRDIPENVREQFTDEQTEALLKVLLKQHAQARHIIDARFTIPLYFTRYYVVLLLGKDRRTHVGKTMVERRDKGGLFTRIAFTSLLVINGSFMLLLLGLLSAYVIKFTLGINIFPDKHLWDFIKALIS